MISIAPFPPRGVELNELNFTRADCYRLLHLKIALLRFLPLDRATLHLVKRNGSRFDCNCGFASCFIPTLRYRLSFLSFYERLRLILNGRG